MNFFKTETDNFASLLPLPDNTTATMSYVPFQTDKTMYDEEIAFNSGSLFKELDKPFDRGAIK